MLGCLAGLALAWSGLDGWLGEIGRCLVLLGLVLVCLCGVDYAPHAGLPRGSVPSCAIEELEFSTWRDLLTLLVGSLKRKLNWGAHLCIATPEAV